MKVMLVDDSKTMRNIQKGILTQLGYTEVEEACDGLDALSKVGAFQPAHDIARAPQAAAYRPANTTQTGVGRMTAEDVDIRIELVQREQEKRERTVLSRRDCPVVLENFAERLRIE